MRVDFKMPNIRNCLNKIETMQDQFKRVISPVKNILGLSFGYMIVFNNNKYFKIIENHDCLQKWVDLTHHSNIFCSKNITNSNDKDYNFTLWPEAPSSVAMEIYKEFGLWNGITISKESRDYIELFWFTKEQYEKDWYKFFIRNKSALIEFISYFDFYKSILSLPVSSNDKELFHFKEGFSREMPLPKTIDEISCIDNFRKKIHSDYTKLKSSIISQTPLSFREIEVLTAICHGHTHKTAARQLMISTQTIKFHLNNIKAKADLYSKTDLIKFYEQNFSSLESKTNLFR